MNKFLYKNWINIGLLLGFYFLNKKYKYTNKLLNDNIDDILNSKEVKGAGIDLLENLFKDKVIKTRVVISLKEVIKEKAFEDDFKIFIKGWLITVIKDKEFLGQTKKTLIEVLRTKEVQEELGTVLKHLANHQSSKDTVSDVFKGIFLGNSVFPKFCELFENCSLNAIQSNKFKSASMWFNNRILSDQNLKSKLYSKALNMFESANKYIEKNKN